MRNHKFTILFAAVIGLSLGFGFAKYKDQRSLNAAMESNETSPRVLDQRIDKERAAVKHKNEDLKLELDEQSELIRREETIILKRSLEPNPSNL